MGGIATPVVVGIATLLGLAALLRPKLMHSETWRATVTPLASIIGSGFLVIAPLMGATVGKWAPLAMAVIVVFAYVVGAVIRFNIAYLEPALESREAPHFLADMERLSDLALGFAYVISVAFYLRLLASFVLRGLGGDIELEARILTTALLGAIGLLGWLRGLGGLEVLENTAVAVKLSIIGALLAGLLLFDASHWSDTFDMYQTGAGVSVDGWTLVRSLAGMLLVVQGFETSRYLGASHSSHIRITTMRYAQLVSGTIYIVFISLMVPLFDTFPAQIDDTAILDAARQVTVFLVPLIVVAAAASQLSAGVADTAGGGGLLVSNGKGRRGPRVGYVAVVLGAMTVVWATDVFAIIAFASRAFAVYYLLQALMAFLRAGDVLTGRSLWLARAGIGTVAAALAFVAVGGIPAA